MDTDNVEKCSPGPPPSLTIQPSAFIGTYPPIQFDTATPDTRPPGSDPSNLRPDSQALRLRVAALPMLLHLAIVFSIILGRNV
jgi:hypothetical protein